MWLKHVQQEKASLLGKPVVSSIPICLRSCCWVQRTYTQTVNLETRCNCAVPLWCHYCQQTRKVRYGKHMGAEHIGHTQSCPYSLRWQNSTTELLKTIRWRVWHEFARGQIDNTRQFEDFHLQSSMSIRYFLPCLLSNIGWNFWWSTRVAKKIQWVGSTACTSLVLWWERIWERDKWLWNNTVRNLLHQTCRPRPLMFSSSVLMQACTLTDKVDISGPDIVVWIMFTPKFPTGRLVQRDEVRPSSSSHWLSRGSMQIWLHTGLGGASLQRPGVPEDKQTIGNLHEHTTSSCRIEPCVNQRPRQMEASVEIEHNTATYHCYSDASAINVIAPHAAN